MLGGMMQSIGVGGTVEAGEMNVSWLTFDNTNERLGIGVASPDEKLQVNGASGLDGATPPTIKIHSSSAGTWTDNATFAKLAFGNDDTSGGIACSINAYVDSVSGNNAGLSFYTSATANNPTERLRIDKGGKVGIGTISPTSNLHIVETGTDAVGSITIDSQEDNAVLQLRAGLDGGGGEEATINLYQGTTVKWQVGNTSGDNFFIYDYTRNGTSFRIQDNGDMALMESGGNVGIGTTVPSIKLDVNGGQCFSHVDRTSSNLDSDNCLDVTDISVIRTTESGGFTVDGLKGGVTGQILHIFANGSGAGVTLKHNDSALDATNRIIVHDTSDMTLSGYGGITLIKSPSYWITIGSLL